MTANRTVELESTEPAQAFRLDVDDDADDLLVRRIFDPAFIVWCIDERDPRPQLEVEDGTVVLAVKGHLRDEPRLDALLTTIGGFSRALERGLRAQAAA